MKKSFKIVLATVLAAGFMACSASKEKQLEGKWKIADMTTPDMKDAYSMLDGLPEDQKEAAKKQIEEGLKKMKEGTFEFKADKSFEINIMGQSEKGTWSLSEDGTKLFTKDEKKTDTISIAEISDKKVVLEDKAKELKVTLEKAQ